jgi:hypothetical protein
VALGCVIIGVFAENFARISKWLVGPVSLLILIQGAHLAHDSYLLMREHGNTFDSRSRVVAWVVEKQLDFDRFFVEEGLAFLPSHFEDDLSRAVVVERDSLVARITQGGEGIYVMSAATAELVSGLSYNNLVIFSTGERPTPMAPNFWRTNSQKIFVLSLP